LEDRISELQQQVNQPEFFAGEQNIIQPVLDELAESEKTIEELYLRWESLEQ